MVQSKLFLEVYNFVGHQQEDPGLFMMWENQKGHLVSFRLVGEDN